MGKDDEKEKKDASRRGSVSHNLMSVAIMQRANAGTSGHAVYVDDGRLKEKKSPRNRAAAGASISLRGAMFFTS
jgi:hypothetical protein